MLQREVSHERLADRVPRPLARGEQRKKCHDFDALLRVLHGLARSFHAFIPSSSRSSSSMMSAGNGPLASQRKQKTWPLDMRNSAPDEPQNGQGFSSAMTR